MMYSVQETHLSRLRPTIPAILKMVSRTADGMFAVDATGKILAWNAAAETILGYAAEEAVGRPCWEIIGARDAGGNPFCFQGCAVMKAAEAGRLFRNFDTQATTKENKKIWLNTSILLVPDAAGDGSIIVHLFRPTASPREENRRAAGGLHLPPEALETLRERPALTPREREVLILLGRCLVAKEIASELGIGVETARTHIQRILKKLHVHSKLEAVVLAAREGLLPSS